jgi:hypothetical protein
MMSSDDGPHLVTITPPENAETRSAERAGDIVISVSRRNGRIFLVVQ